MASVNEYGTILTGNLDRSGTKFAQKALSEIAKGIKTWWNYV